jgi:hypothetical protein
MYYVYNCNDNSIVSEPFEDWKEVLMELYVLDLYLEDSNGESVPVSICEEVDSLEPLDYMGRPAPERISVDSCYAKKALVLSWEPSLHTNELTMNQVWCVPMRVPCELLGTYEDIYVPCNME